MLFFFRPGQDVTASPEERPSRAAERRQQKSAEQQATSPQQQQEEEKCARLHTGRPLQIGATWHEPSHPCALLTDSLVPFCCASLQQRPWAEQQVPWNTGLFFFFLLFFFLFFSFGNCKSKRIDAHPLSNNFFYRVIFLPSSQQTYTACLLRHLLFRNGLLGWLGSTLEQYLEQLAGLQGQKKNCLKKITKANGLKTYKNEKKLKCWTTGKKKKIDFFVKWYV